MEKEEMEEEEEDEEEEEEEDEEEAKRICPLEGFLQASKLKLLFEYDIMLNDKTQESAPPPTGTWLKPSVPLPMDLPAFRLILFVEELQQQQEPDP